MYSSSSVARACRAALLLCALSRTAAAAEPAVAQPIDACALLSASDVAQVIGRDVEQGQRHDLGLQEDRSWSSTCVWKVKQPQAAEDPTAPLGGASFVILNAMRWPAGSGLARSFLDAFRDAAARGEIPSTPVPKRFGDEALWWGDGLAVRRGDVSFGVSVFVPALPGTRRGQPEEQLATRILRQLDSLR